MVKELSSFLLGGIHSYAESTCLRLNRGKELSLLFKSPEILTLQLSPLQCVHICMCVHVSMCVHACVLPCRCMCVCFCVSCVHVWCACVYIYVYLSVSVCVCLSHPVLGMSQWKERLDLTRVIYIDWQGVCDFWGGIGTSNSSTCQAANRRYREWLWLVRVSHKPTSWSPSPRKDLWELSRKNSVGICVLGGSSHPTQPCFSSLHTATSVLWFLNFLLYF